jgi:hypothetical protein
VPVSRICAVRRPTSTFGRSHSDVSSPAVEISHHCGSGRVIIVGRIAASSRSSVCAHASSATAKSMVCPWPPVRVVEVRPIRLPLANSSASLPNPRRAVTSGAKHDAPIAGTQSSSIRCRASRRVWAANTTEVRGRASA